MVVVLFRVRGLTQSSSPAAEPVSLGPTLGLTLVVSRPGSVPSRAGRPVVRRLPPRQPRCSLGSAQHGRCFYCGTPMLARWEVDHSCLGPGIPDNTIDNLVAAHAACNNAESASLAGLEHLRRWTGLFRPGQLSNAVQYMADVTGWPRRSDWVLSTARAIYLWLPQGTRAVGPSIRL
jgi:hypothetical protein